MNDLIESAFQYNCIKQGVYTLKSGSTSKYYFDFKNIISYPDFIKKIGDTIYNLCKTDINLIAADAVGGIPIASYISTTYNIPMIIVRDSIKKYGTENIIVGEYTKEQNCLLIDDVMTSGGSLRDAIEVLENKVNIKMVYVIMDRQETNSTLIVNDKKYVVNSLINKTDITQHRLNNIMIQKKSRICLSLDIENQDDFFGVLDKVGSKVVILKIHSDIIVGNVNEFIKKCILYSIRYNFLIMEDRKFVDISYITGNIVFSDYLQIPYIEGTGEVAIFCGAIIGSCLGFLWFNAPPAKIFMGDTGSLALGGSLGAVGIITKHEIVLAITGGLFVLEAVSVMVQVISFKLTGKRIFRMAPIHHHFEKKGWPESTVVIRFWIISIILAMIGLATLKLR